MKDRSSAKSSCSADSSILSHSGERASKFQTHPSAVWLLLLGYSQSYASISAYLLHPLCMLSHQLSSCSCWIFSLIFLRVSWMQLQLSISLLINWLSFLCASLSHLSVASLTSSAKHFACFHSSYYPSCSLLKWSPTFGSLLPLTAVLHLWFECHCPVRGVWSSKGLRAKHRRKAN